MKMKHEINTEVVAASAAASRETTPKTRVKPGAAAEAATEAAAAAAPTAAASVSISFSFHFDLILKPHLSFEVLVRQIANSLAQIAVSEAVNDPGVSAWGKQKKTKKY